MRNLNPKRIFILKQTLSVFIQALHLLLDIHAARLVSETKSQSFPKSSETKQRKAANTHFDYYAQLNNLCLIIMHSLSQHPTQTARQFPGQGRHVDVQVIQTQRTAGLSLPSVSYHPQQSFPVAYRLLPLICWELPGVSLSWNYTLKGAPNMNQIKESRNKQQQK